MSRDNLIYKQQGSILIRVGGPRGSWQICFQRKWWILLFFSSESFYNMKVWIGLNNINMDQSFNKWTDMYYVDYTYWANGYPMVTLGVENCVASKNGMWKNMDCAAKNTFVCKMEAKPMHNHVWCESSFLQNIVIWIYFFQALLLASMHFLSFTNKW